MNYLSIAVFVLIVMPSAYIYVFGCPSFFTFTTCGINEARALFVLIIASVFILLIKT